MVTESDVYCSELLCSLEFSAVVSDVWLGVRAWDSAWSAEVSLGLSVLGCSQEESVGSSRSFHDKFVKGHAFSTGLLDSGSGGLSESEGSNSHLWYI